MSTAANCIAGIDVHKSVLAVVIREEIEGQVSYIKRSFGATKSEILHLAAWLQQHNTTDVVMESTAQYWRPVWNGLDPHFKLHLTHPLKTRAPRGRKRDFRDAQRLTDRWRSGDLEESFVPGSELRQWRWLTRQRVQLTRKMTVTRNHVEGLLEQGGIKLSAVVTDIFGVSGWAILEKIVEGETNVGVLVNEARGLLRRKQAQLKEALQGQLAPVYRFTLRQLMEEVQMHQNHIEQINRELSQAMKAHLAILARLTKIPGIDLRAAQELVAEVGPTAAAFQCAAQFASWIGVCPGSQESAGVNYSTRSAKGNRYLRRLLNQIAWAAIRVKGSSFSVRFHRLKHSIQPKGAAWAIAHRIAKLVWLVLHDGVEYEERGPEPADPRKQTRKFKRLIRELTKQGMDVRALMEFELAAVSSLG